MVGPIASPLFLFYGLTQQETDVRSGNLGNEWQPAENHPLAFEVTRPTSGVSLDL